MTTLKLGLKENWKQFSLLVLINGFVGAMIGLERTIFPQFAEQEFGITANTAILSFIIVFGISKAFTNYFMGAMANKIGRKNLLVIGWLIGIPVPLILIFASSWNWIVLSNILLGINQGLTWSSAVVMKIDLAGEKNRGLAIGLNESAGYLAVGIVAYLTGWIASEYGIRPYPFYLGLGFVLIGLLTSWIFVKDTQHHIQKESSESKVGMLKNIFWETTWLNKNLGAISQAGLVNNLNDGMIWGLFPVLLFMKGFTLIEIGEIVAIYPIVWGLGQMITGKLSDHYSKKGMLFMGMLFQGLTILGLVYVTSFIQYALLSVILGIGTAIVYPTFMAAIADNTHPAQRAASIGVFRLWRDLGYAFGALITGVLADSCGINLSIGFIGILTLISAFIILLRMKNIRYEKENN